MSGYGYGGGGYGSGGSKFDQPAGGGASKFDSDPAFQSGPPPQFNGGAPGQYGAPPQGQYGGGFSGGDSMGNPYGGGPPQNQYGPPQGGGYGGGSFTGGSRFDSPQFQQPQPQWGGPPLQQQQQWSGGGGGGYGGGGGPGSNYGGGGYGGGPQPQGWDGRQQGNPPMGPGPSVPQGPPPQWSNQPMQPLAHGPGPHPVAPYAPGMEQPAAAGPQGQGHLSGRKRAVLCGCNYKGSSAQLNGCINDSKCIKYLLTTRFGFQEQDIRLLTDDQPNPACWPTRANIAAAIGWLVGQQQPGDDLFFHFSGHGSQTPDRSGEETGGMNDTILPCDYKSAGQIDDNELNQRLVNPLQQGVRLHAVLDACHSGSGLDLPFRCKVKGGVPTWKSEYLPGRMRSHKGTSGGLAIQIAAAGDKETAADTSALSGGTATGAATFCLIQAIEQFGPSITYQQLLLHMDKVLHNMGGSSSGSMGGMLSSFGVDKMLGGVSGGSKILGMLEGGLTAAGMRGGQTPQISANYAFDLNTKLQM